MFPSYMDFSCSIVLLVCLLPVLVCCRGCALSVALQYLWSIPCFLGFVPVISFMIEKVFSSMGWLNVKDLACNACDTPLIEKDQDHIEGRDRISELHEDIMLTVVSQLGMKEAAKASIVSKRWRYLWTNMADLEFDYSIILPESANWICPKPSESIKYINWVDQVVGLHQGQFINKFSIRFGFLASDIHHIDRWVRFAISKRVKILKLATIIRDCCNRGFYTLGFESIKAPSPSPSPSPSLLKYSSLVSLHLVDVQVSGEFVEHLLSECPHLEQLHVEHFFVKVRLSNLKVSSAKLKRLSLHYCVIDELEIDAANLRYLEYFGTATLKFKNVPALVEANIQGVCCVDPVVICQKIACFAMQLSRFTFNVNVDMDIFARETVYVNIPSEGLPRFSNLVHLELMCGYEMMVGLTSVARLLGACPVVREFKMTVYTMYGHEPPEARLLRGLDPLPFGMGKAKTYYYPQYAEEEEEEEQLQNKAALPESLRVFEYIGFKGSEDDVDVILGILDMATDLDTFICQCFTDLCTDENIEKMYPLYLTRAHKFEKYLSPKVNNYVIS